MLVADKIDVIFSPKEVIKMALLSRNVIWIWIGKICCRLRKVK